MDSIEHHIRIPRTARYHVLGDPGSAAEHWFVVHGYRQLAERFIRRFVDLPGLTARRRAVVAPEALSRFYVEERVGPHGSESRVGASWMTRADREHEIRDYVEYLDRLADEVPGEGAGRVVLGFSQGAETASRWCVYGRARPSALILWGGGLAADLDLRLTEEALRETEITFVVGSRDEWAGERAEQSRHTLRELGVRHRTIAYEGGHRIEPVVLGAHWPWAE